MRTVTHKAWGLGVVAGLLLAAAGGGAVAGPVGTGPDVAVVVHADSLEQARSALLEHGGTLERELAFVGAVSGHVTPDAAEALAAMDHVDVTADRLMQFASADTVISSDADLEEDVDVQFEALNPGADWTRATGSGVGVALIDTGVAELPAFSDRLIRGPDYSDEGGDGIDEYGHGTFMAGLIAGGAGDDGKVQRHGVAPGAHIVSLKLAGRDGLTTLSKVLDAIGWVVVNQDEYGIRVLNLSLGVPTDRAPQADPLAVAVEAAWASGITVVTASGNGGDRSVLSPGRDPWVITVGATDPGGTPEIDDDVVTSWSGRGKVTGNDKAELLAPGVDVVSLRVPGSTIDEAFPEARIGDHYFRGSGTSMSTALVSGAVAALAETRPYATPDDLKGALVSTGHALDSSSARMVDLAAADLAEADLAWRQNHKIAFNRIDPRLQHGMPWSQSGAPAPDETWARMGWADGEWTRMGWADSDWARMGWARMGWADANMARMGWADDNFTRMGWARMGWARMGWARMGWAGQDWPGNDDAWARMGWARMGWADAAWGTEPQ